MSQELLYTSAPKGLRPGSRGFCTVVTTHGMSAPMAAALESLSAYRSVYPAGDSRASQNPVVWSHVKLPATGKTCHVLSRVSDYGLDYSQRSNKLAHHVVLEPAERPLAGPAWLLSQPGFMQVDWDGEPRVLPAGRAVKRGDQRPGVCTNWQLLTGDAGWAGVLAEAFLNDPARPVYILFEPGMDLLPLFTEAISLLPADRRWEVTFSTYFTNLPPAAVCNWRCVLADSPEAQQSRRFVHALRIDLCAPLPAASGGELVELARTGRHVSGVAATPPAAAVPASLSETSLLEQLELDSVTDDIDDLLEAEVEAPRTPPVPELPRHEPPSVVPATHGADQGGYSPELPLSRGAPPVPRSREKIEAMYAAGHRRGRWIALAIVAGILSCFAASAVVFQLKPRLTWDTVATFSPANDQSAVAISQPREDAAGSDRDANQPLAESAESKDRPSDQSVLSTQKTAKPGDAEPEPGTERDDPSREFKQAPELDAKNHSPNPTAEPTETSPKPKDADTGHSATPDELNPEPKTVPESDAKDGSPNQQAVPTEKSPKSQTPEAGHDAKQNGSVVEVKLGNIRLPDENWTSTRWGALAFVGDITPPSEITVTRASTIASSSTSPPKLTWELLYPPHNSYESKPSKDSKTGAKEFRISRLGSSKILVTQIIDCTPHFSPPHMKIQVIAREKNSTDIGFRCGALWIQGALPDSQPICLVLSHPPSPLNPPTLKGGQLDLPIPEFTRGIKKLHIAFQIALADSKIVSELVQQQLDNPSSSDTNNSLTFNSSWPTDASEPKVNMTFKPDDANTHSSFHISISDVSLRKNSRLNKDFKEIKFPSKPSGSPGGSDPNVISLENVLKGRKDALSNRSGKELQRLESIETDLKKNCEQQQKKLKAAIEKLTQYPDNRVYQNEKATADQNATEASLNSERFNRLVKRVDDVARVAHGLNSAKLINLRVYYTMSGSDGADVEVDIIRAGPDAK